MDLERGRAGLCAAVAIGELTVRELKPTPRVQIVAAEGGLRDLAGSSPKRVTDS